MFAFSIFLVFIPIYWMSHFIVIRHLMSFHIVLTIFLILCFLQIELGFGNGVVDDVFFVPGYSISGFVVAQVMFVEGTNHFQNFTFLLLLLYHFLCKIIML